MNILFLTLSSMENIDERGIYTDLVRELANRGINIYVVTPREKRTGLDTEVTVSNNVHILKVKTGNITKTKFIEKGISTLKIENQYLKSIKQNFKNVNFDMVMYSTPPITFEKIVNYYKKNHNSKSYLVLKDIFPQNAVDIEIIKEKSLLWKYFRRKEERLYKMSDCIGCMSQGNVDYILKHNLDIRKEKVEIFPNAIMPVNRERMQMNGKVLKEKYGIPSESTLFVYGGNLGRPQGIDFLLEVASNFQDIKNSFLLIVGSGTEYKKIEEFINTNELHNVKLFNKLPKNDYDTLLEVTDVGLIFLDRRFTIPNIPSRLTAYMEYSLPILAATDKNTDLSQILYESDSGFWCESGDINNFLEYANKLAKDKELRVQMGASGREYLESNYDIRKVVDIIIKHL